jgi:hypothetical protein
MIKDYGLQLKKVETEEKYIFGAKMLPEIILCEDGDWTPFVPEYEPQFNKNFDTSGCPIFGTINAVEMIEKRISGGDFNYSERFHYNQIPLRPPGGDPHDAAESIRKFGMVAQETLPMTETFAEYILPEPNSPEVIKMGQEWLETHDFGHEYLWRAEHSAEVKNELLAKALKSSPVGVSVTAWEIDPLTGLYVDMGRPNCHWCVLVKMFHDEHNRLIRRVFDTYDHAFKDLDPNHRILIAKRYHLDVKQKVYNGSKQTIRKESFISKIIKFINELFPKNTIVAFQS